VPRATDAGRKAGHESRARRSRSCARARIAPLVAAALVVPAVAPGQEPQPVRPVPTPPPSAFQAKEPASPLSGTFPAPSVGAPPPAIALPSPKIVQIAVEGGKTVTGETIGFYLGIKVGEPYDPDVIKRNFMRLWDSALFDDLRIEKEVVPGGVKVVAYVVERPRVTDLEFRGNKKLTGSTLKDKLKEGKAEIHVPGPVTLQDLSKAKAVLLDAYHAEGFRSAAVEATMEPINEAERRVVFQIDEGDKIKIDSIKFTGNTVFGGMRLRRAMKKTHQRHWYTFWDTKTVYNQANYEEDVESLRHVYQDAGYKDVVVKDPVIETYVVNPKAKPGKIKRRARITIPIVEGEKFYFGKITVDGTTVFNAARLEKIFVYKPGKPLSHAVLADGMKVIDTIYRGRGYIYAFMNPEYEEKGNHVVDVKIAITEGDQYRLGRVEFTGNKTTRDKVLRRELPLAEGDIMDMESFKKGLFKVTQLGYFKIEEDPDFRVNNEKKVVDITVKGTDTNRNEVQFGAGYSQLDGLFGQFQFSTRNFLGRGDTVGVQLQRGNRSNFFDLSFSEPYFLDQRMSLGGALFNRSLTYLDVDQRTKGVNLSYGLGLGFFDVASLFYGFTDTKSKYEVFPAPPPPGAGNVPIAYADFAGRTSSITPGYRYDSRNDPFDPSRGKRYGLSVTLAGGPLGGDFSYIKPAANITYYIPVGRKSNFAVNLEGGWVRPYGGKDVPIFERFRIGGDRSVRGFEFGAIYPVDSKNHAFFNDEGALLGGDKFLVFNLEYVYAIAGPLKVAAFFDAGNAWLEGQTPNIFKMRSSTGLEMRIFLPIFQAPLRFIYGVNLDPKTLLDKDGFVLPNGQEKRTNFQFSIGTTF
jgi:outer membrane protein insertion porin family